jgi:hypothetical protein
MTQVAEHFASQDAVFFFIHLPAGDPFDCAQDRLAAKNIKE